MLMIDAIAQLNATQEPNQEDAVNSQLEWEQERKVRATFASNNTRNHTNFKDLYATAEHNIEVLASSCFALADNYVKVEKGF